VGDWYYIGHYGQLGPLTREQINDLIAAEVIARETYVWRVGMSEWVFAGQVPELAAYFQMSAPSVMPPPPPPTPSIPSGPSPAPVYNIYATYPRTLATIKSDKSRLVAGILQLIIPGVGRMYLGYGAYGVLQLVFSLCGAGWIWSVVDGVYILAGGVKYDGYGRRLGE